MEAHPTTLITQALAAKLGAGNGAADVAHLVALAWREIAHSLSPILGDAGVAALCKRTFHVAARQHPFLALHAGEVRNCDTVALEHSLAVQTADNAAAAGGTLLIEFNDLLGKLVGLDLTDRLLRSVWDLLSNAMPSKDASP